MLMSLSSIKSKYKIDITRITPVGGDSFCIKKDLI
jgi:hypothetical protein